MSVKSNLEALCLISAISGHEQPVASYMKEHFIEAGLKPEIDRMGNCIATVEGQDPSLPSILVFGHMDQIGFMVKYIEDDGFIRVERLGGVPERVMPAREVCIIARDGSSVDGVIGMKSHHATSADEKYVVRKVDASYIDIGATSRSEVKALGIDIGSPVVYSPKYTELKNGFVSATSLDNRVACTVVLELAKKLQSNAVKNTVHLAGTVQEEFNDRGATIAARAVQPDMAICIDICLEHGTPDMKGTGEVQLGAGPTISLYNFHGRGTLNGTIPHPGMVKLIEHASEKSGINTQRSVSIGLLTDLAYAQFEGMGLKAIDIGIPCRYTHSPTEMCSLRDVEQAADLIYEAITQLPNSAIER